MGNGAVGEMKDPALKRPKLAINDDWVTAENLPGDLAVSGSPWVWMYMYSMGNNYIGKATA